MASEFKQNKEFAKWFERWLAQIQRSRVGIDFNTREGTSRESETINRCLPGKSDQAF